MDRLCDKASYSKTMHKILQGRKQDPDYGKCSKIYNFKLSKYI